jgi:hypothetical protein
VLIFQHATSPANPFLASAGVLGCSYRHSSSPSYSSAYYSPKATSSSTGTSNSTLSHSFLNFPHTQGHLLREYRQSMRTKCDLTLVCKLWWAIGQEVLFEIVWLTRAREASLLAGLLSVGEIRSADVSSRTTLSGMGFVEVEDRLEEEERIVGTMDGVLGRVMSKGKEKERDSLQRPTGSFEGISLSTTTSVSYSTTTPASASTSSSRSHTPSSSMARRARPHTFPYDTCAIGRHIRRLHIETHSLDRCAPEDLLKILAHAPALQVFSDHQSIRRTSGFCVLRGSVSSGLGSFSSSSNLGGGSSATTISAGDASFSLSPSQGSFYPLSGRQGSSSNAQLHQGALHTLPQHQQESEMQLLSALTIPHRRTTSLRRLSWTSYEYEAGDFEAGAFPALLHFPFQTSANDDICQQGWHSTHVSLVPNCTWSLRISNTSS